MRDIRADLEDRASFLKEQMDAAQAEFERHVDQLKQEHDSKLKGLKADLDAVTTLLGAEQRRLGNGASAPKAKPERQAPKPQAALAPQAPHAPQARPQMRLADMFGLQRTG